MNDSRSRYSSAKIYCYHANPSKGAVRRYWRLKTLSIYECVAKAARKICNLDALIQPFVRYRTEARQFQMHFAEEQTAFRTGYWIATLPKFDEGCS